LPFLCCSFLPRCSMYFSWISERERTHIHSRHEPCKEWMKRQRCEGCITWSKIGKATGSIETATNVPFPPFCSTRTIALRTDKTPRVSADCACVGRAALPSATALLDTTEATSAVGGGEKNA
jgi:hypothetical protein